MGKKTALSRTCSLFLIVILLFGTSISFSQTDYSYASQVSSGETLAENGEITKATLVKGSNIKDGDVIVIAGSNTNTALSTELSGSRIKTSSITTQEAPGAKTITSISEDIALLKVVSTGDTSEEYYLKCENGYLTSGETGNSLRYDAEPSEYSKWTFEDDVYLHNSNAHYNSNKNQYLQLYNGRFTTYGKTASSNLAPFTMDFYLWTSDIPSDDNASYYLPVFETSDTHGYIAEQSDNDYLYLLAYISDKVKDVRGYGQDTRKDKALLLDGGDIYQGNILSNVFYGKPLSAAYHFMEYDAVTVGNHEFDWGIERVCDTDHTMADYAVGDEKGDNTVPIVVSNIFKNGNYFEYADKYRIIEKTATDKNGNEIKVKVGVVGFAGDYTKSIMQDKFSKIGYSIDYDVNKANELAKGLEEGGQCDITILLAHDDAAQLAPQLPQDTPFDLVLGGHTHRNTNGVTNWGLRYIEPSSNARSYAQCEIAFELENNKPVFKKVANAKLVNTKSNLNLLKKTPENADNLDPRIVEITDKAITDAKEILDTKVGYITESILRFTFLPESGNRSTTCGNWVTSLIARASKADIAFSNGTGLRIELPLENGATSREITLADVHSLFPFGNKIYLFEITYEDLLTALKYALSDQGKILLTTLNGIDCYFTGENVEDIVTSCGEVIYSKGVWKDDWNTKTIKVALSEYVATTQRISSNGLTNPFYDWAQTSKLISSDLEDFNGAISVLNEEAKNNNSHLSIDTAPHFLEHQYDSSDKKRYQGHLYEEIIQPATFKDDGFITQKCTRCGSVKNQTRIKRIDSVALSQTSFMYNGKIQKPKALVKDSAGNTIPSQYYSVSYLDSNKNPVGSSIQAGTYYARIHFSGKYSGVKDVAYKITPAVTPPAPKISGLLLNKMTAKGKTSLVLKWSKVKGVAGYDIFFSQCNHSHKKRICKKVKTINGNKSFSWTKKNLRKGCAYKAFVKAYTISNGKKKYVTQSPQVHAYTNNGNSTYTNARAIKVAQSKITLQKGQTRGIKASIVKMIKSKACMTSSHAPSLRYASSNEKIATVNKSGKVKAKSKGACDIWALAHNGVYEKVRVTVS